MQPAINFFSVPTKVDRIETERHTQQTKELIERIERVFVCVHTSSMHVCLCFLPSLAVFSGFSYVLRSRTYEFEYLESA